METTPARAGARHRQHPQWADEEASACARLEEFHRLSSDDVTVLDGGTQIYLVNFLRELCDLVSWCSLPIDYGLERAR